MNKRIHRALFVSLALALPVLAGCNEQGTSAEQTAKAEASEFYGASREFDGIRLNPERIYRLYFSDPNQLTAADVEFSVDIEMHSYRAARQCMEDSGHDFEMPSREQLRQRSSVMAQMNETQAETVAVENTAPVDPGDPHDDLTVDCLEVFIGLQKSILEVLAPFQEAFTDALRSAMADPRVLEAQQGVSDCLAESGFGPIVVGESAPIEGSDSNYEQTLERCSEQAEAVMDQVLDERYEQFNDEYRLQIMDAILGN